MIGDFTLGANHLPCAAAFGGALHCGLGRTNRGQADSRGGGFQADCLRDLDDCEPHTACDPRSKLAGDR